MQFDPNNNKKCFLSYFDLLGISRLIENNNIENIFSVYSLAIEKASLSTPNIRDKVKKIWFSDTFIFYTPNDTFDSFSAIELFSRYFINTCINYLIPLRGAISFGSMYIDIENDLIVGKPLLESHRYCEHQNCIGLVITPSVKNEVSPFFDNGNTLKYCTDKIEFKFHNEKGIEYQHVDTIAYLLGDTYGINGSQVILDKLIQMKTKITDEDIIRKYTNTINFIDKHKGSRLYSVK
jgi:hypothetical protein